MRWLGYYAMWIALMFVMFGLDQGDGRIFVSLIAATALAYGLTQKLERHRVERAEEKARGARFQAALERRARRGENEGSTPAE